MQIKDEDVKKIARLASLQINDDETNAIAGHLSNIFDLVEQMNQVDSEGVEPMAHPLDITQRLRADVVTEKDQRERFQALAPEAVENLYLVPKVIDN